MGRSKDRLKVLAPPKPNEYLPAAIQKAVLDTGIKHPATIYPVALGAGTGFIGWLFGMPAFYIGALTGLLFGPAWAIIQIYFLNQKIGHKYISQLNKRQKKYQKYLKNLIKQGLEDCKKIKYASQLAIQAIEQFNSIQRKYDNIRELLEMKLNTSEITFGRFLGATEQVSLSVLDNLNNIVGILKSMESIDLDYVKYRLISLKKIEKKSKENIDEENALKERLKLWDDQMTNVKALLTNNEIAMTEMEQISAAIAKWKTGGKFADTDFESAIVRLQELASQAHEYN